MGQNEEYNKYTTTFGEKGEYGMSLITVDSQKLIETRVKAGFSQNTLAKKSNTSSALISRLEANKANPRPTSAVKICEALGVDFDSLFSIGGVCNAKTN